MQSDFHLKQQIFFYFSAKNLSLSQLPSLEMGWGQSLVGGRLHFLVTSIPLSGSSSNKTYVTGEVRAYDVLTDSYDVILKSGQVLSTSRHQLREYWDFDQTNSSSFPSPRVLIDSGDVEFCVPKDLHGYVEFSRMVFDSGGTAKAGMNSQALCSSHTQSCLWIRPPFFAYVNMRVRRLQQGCQPLNRC